MIAYGVTLYGNREVLSIEPFVDESYETWRSFFDKLKQRGVKNIALLVSDAHKDIQKAHKEAFIGSSYQRCKVHFMRNILAHIPHRAKKTFANKLKQIWLQADKDDAVLIANTI